MIDGMTLIFSSLYIRIRDAISVTILWCIAYIINEMKMMRRSTMSMSLPILVLTLVMTSLVAQGQGSICGNTFFSSLVQLIPCRAAVVPFSPIPPSETCCSALKALGQPCLCVLVNGPPISGVDRGMAMQLPEKCSASFDPCEIAN